MCSRMMLEGEGKGMSTDFIRNIEMKNYMIRNQMTG